MGRTLSSPPPILQFGLWLTARSRHCAALASTQQQTNSMHQQVYSACMAGKGFASQCLTLMQTGYVLLCAGLLLPGTRHARTNALREIFRLVRGLRCCIDVRASFEFWER